MRISGHPVSQRILRGHSGQLGNTCGFLYGRSDATPDAVDGIRDNGEQCEYLGVPLKYHQNSNTHKAEVAGNVQGNTLEGET